MDTRDLVRYSNLRDLVDQHPAEVVEFLLRCLPEKTDELASVIFRANQRTKGPVIDTTVANSPYTERDTSVRTKPSDAQRPGSSAGGRRSFRDLQTSRPRLPPSPTGTTSSHSRSLASKDGRENILILATGEEGDVQEHVARMKTAQIEYSVIADHMFHDGRICEDNIISLPAKRLTVPVRSLPGTSKDVIVSSGAKLTWVRPPSSSTYKTLFYLVPSEDIDIDVLLGCHDSGEGKCLPSGAR